MLGSFGAHDDDDDDDDEYGNIGALIITYIIARVPYVYDILKESETIF